MYKNINKNNKVKRIESIYNSRHREMFPIKRIELLHNELNRYYYQVIAFQDKDLQYQDIKIEFSRIITELKDVIEDMRKYNNNKNDQIINLST